MFRMVVATHNPHKLTELQAILARFGVHTSSAADYDLPEVVEDGESLSANARKKAFSAAKHAGVWALADDTGLEVDALAGDPGVYAARFAGPRASYEDNNALLLDKLAGIPPSGRTARFRCVVVVARPDQTEPALEVCGELQGTIGLSPQGACGFGYDPLFMPLGSSLTLAQISATEKNRLSHRGRALGKLEAELERLVHGQ